MNRTDSENKKSNKKNSQFLNQAIRNRKNSLNNNLIIKAFNTSNCVVEEDWQEWFKSTTKILFEQSPSYSLYHCRSIADYYFPLILELYNYAFYLAYINNNDNNKVDLTTDLDKALKNPKSPNEILLTILKKKNLNI